MSPSAEGSQALHFIFESAKVYRILGLFLHPHFLTFNTSGRNLFGNGIHCIAQMIATTQLFVNTTFQPLLQGMTE
jgi:hypothetical protein